MTDEQDPCDGCEVCELGAALAQERADHQQTLALLAVVEARVADRVRADLAEQVLRKIEVLTDRWRRMPFAEYVTTSPVLLLEEIERAIYGQIAAEARVGSSPDTTPEPAREDYPGHLSTPDACPVCGGRVEVDRLDVTSLLTPMAQRPKTIPGRWWCPKGCDPRTTPEPLP